MPILEAHNISKIYYKTEETIPVLNQLNIVVEKGERSKVCDVSP